MSWRVVVVSRRCKLEYKLGYLVCRGEETKKIFISEIGVLIIESTGVALTTALLCELIKAKVNIVFCDEKHNPHAQLLALNGRFDSGGRIRKQLCWNEEVQGAVWAEIVRLKIGRQKALLNECGSAQADLLERYMGEVQAGDMTNREGHAAKVYFNALFGAGFKRGTDNFLNSALNYGYSVILSAFNREVVSNGYLTQLGIAHKNEFNAFNLSCDLMEPFRVLVDRFVMRSAKELTPEYKHELCNILNERVNIGGEQNTVSAAIALYSKSVFSALETGNVNIIKCYEL